jgi:hypothetical protein
MEQENKSLADTTSKYLSILDNISQMQARLLWAEIVFLALDVGVFLFIVNQIMGLKSSPGMQLPPIGLTLIFFCIAVGLMISTYWITFILRAQLKLKLRFFQARYLERKLGAEGEHFLTDEVSFNKQSQILKSPDGVETVTYPKSLEGRLGSTRSWHLSSFMPTFFAALYFLIFIWAVFEISVII